MNRSTWFNYRVRCNVLYALLVQLVTSSVASRCRFVIVGNKRQQPQILTIQYQAGIVFKIYLTPHTYYNTYIQLKSEVCFTTQNPSMK